MRGTPRRALWALALLLLTSWAASAQTPTRDNPFPELFNARRWGPFMVDLQFPINNIGYDGNVFLAPPPIKGVQQPAKIESDYLINLGPDVKAQVRFGQRLVLTLHDKVSGELFLRHANLNHLDNDFDGTADLSLGPLLLSGYLQRIQAEQRPNSEIDQRPKRVDTWAGIGARFFLSETIDLAGKALTQKLDYTDRDSVEISRLLDRTTDEIQAEAGWRPQQRARFFARYARRDYDFNSDTEGRDSRETRTLVGIEFRPKARLSGTLAVGHAKLESKRNAALYKPFDGSIADASVVYRPTGAFRVTLRGIKGVDFSVFPNNLYYRLSDAQADFNWFLGTRWGVQWGGQKTTLDFPQATPILSELVKRRDDVKNYWAGVLFRLTGGAEFGIRIGRRNRSSNDIFAVDHQTYIQTTGSFQF